MSEEYTVADIGKFLGNMSTDGYFAEIDFKTTLKIGRQLLKVVNDCETHIEMLIDKDIQSEIGINAADVEHARTLDHKVLRICSALNDKDEMIEALDGEINLLQQQLADAKE